MTPEIIDLHGSNQVSGRNRVLNTGSKSARNKCASVRASTASVFTRADAIAFVRSGWPLFLLVKAWVLEAGSTILSAVAEYDTTPLSTWFTSPGPLNSARRSTSSPSFAPRAQSPRRTDLWGRAARGTSQGGMGYQRSLREG